MKNKNKDITKEETFENDNFFLPGRLYQYNIKKSLRLLDKTIVQLYSGVFKERVEAISVGKFGVDKKCMSIKATDSKDFAWIISRDECDLIK